MGIFNEEEVFRASLGVIEPIIVIGSSCNPIPGRGVVGRIGFNLSSISNGAGGESLFVIEFSKEDVLAVEFSPLCSAGA